MTRLTPHFTLAELTRSDVATRRGLDNTPPAPALANLARLAAQLEVVRREFAGPVLVTSGYRSPPVNAAVGGSATSAHMDGRAADITIPGYPPERVARWIVEHLARLDVDQVILEFPPDGWVHLAIPAAGVDGRRQVFTATSRGGQPVYSPGLRVATA
jgi:hypothetical protein